MGTLCVQEITKEQLEELPDTERENVIVGWNGERAVLWKTICRADHCTPEERAVIDAAVVLDGALSPPLGTWENTPYALIGWQFHNVVVALLAARAKKGL